MSTACPGAVQVPAGAWDRGGCGCGLSPHALPWSDSPVSGGGGCGSWEHEKSRRALKWREEQRKESYTKDDSEKDSDTGDDQPDTLEPPEVASARESIAALVGEESEEEEEGEEEGSESECESPRWVLWQAHVTARQPPAAPGSARRSLPSSRLSFFSPPLSGPPPPPQPALSK